MGRHGLDGYHRQKDWLEQRLKVIPAYGEFRGVKLVGLRGWVDMIFSEAKAWILVKTIQRPWPSSSVS